MFTNLKIVSRRMGSKSENKTRTSQVCTSVYKCVQVCTMNARDTQISEMKFLLRKQTSNHLLAGSPHCKVDVVMDSPCADSIVRWTL